MGSRPPSPPSGVVRQKSGPTAVVATPVRSSEKRANSGSTIAWCLVPLRPNMKMGARPAPQPPPSLDDFQP